MYNCNFYLPKFIKLRGERSMEFWIIMIVLIAIGGTCSLEGTWWDKKWWDKKKKKEEKK